MSAMIGTARAQWPQWGGPNRNFTVETSGLADKWPEDGPPGLWHRALGDGYSGIVVDDGLVFTTYRKNHTDEVEFTVALDVRTGRTVWEHSIPSPLVKPVRDWGHGPNSTPLIVGDRLYSIGTNAVVQCFDKKKGTVFWKHDLVREFDVPPITNVGYSCSPIAYKNTIIVPADMRRADESGATPPGTPGAARPRSPASTLMAFDAVTGDLLWRSLDLRMGVASPILIQDAGQDELVVYTVDGVVGVDPSNGKLRWHVPFTAETVVATPVWNGADLIFYSSADEAIGSSVISLSNQGSEVERQTLWSNRKVRGDLGTPVRDGDYIYIPQRDLLTCVNIRTGERLWVERGYPTASCVRAGRRLLVLDQNGQLTLAGAAPDGLSVLARSKVAERFSFTVPTLVDTTLYVRDRKHIMALDLGKRGVDGAG
jgi:outer membrane protein assembly factor BamB